MKNSRGVKAVGIIIISAFILADALTLRAQDQLQSVQAESNSVVAIVADAEGFPTVPNNQLPLFGTYWTVLSYTPFSIAPVPYAPLDPTQGVYSMGNNSYLVDVPTAQLPASQQYGNRALSQAEATSIVQAQATALLNLIEQIQTAQSADAGATMSRGGMMRMDYDSSGAMPMFSFATNGLWLDITGITNNLAYLDLYNATNQVYEILTKTDLSLTNWTIEDEVWPTNSTKMPFNIAELGRTNLFAWAMDWTGVTENGNTTPDWWFWEYFGTVDLSDTNLDTTGDITLLYDYQHGRNPNVIQFSLLFTNISFSTNVVNGSISLEAGVPAYEAILINDTNTADAVWEPYSSTNLTVILPGNGTYGVEVGLKGFAPNATPIWQTISLTCLNPDAFPLVLSITNPAGSTVSVPVIQLQGLANKGLSNLVYDINNANGVTTGRAGYWRPYYYDTSLLAFTTNAFQCYDIALATGLNTITLHATDVAGNTITTNISYTLNYSGDHTAPVLSIIWPTNGTSIAGSNVTVQAQIDDATATVSAVINGITNQALVERNGTVWFNNLALAGGTNALTITATDAAGNVSTTNLIVIQSPVNFTITPLTSGQLNQPSVTVTGTIGDSTENVSINGVVATVTGNNWSAANVPVTPDGTAALNARVTDSGNNPLAIQTVYQPQPATVVVEAYEQTYRDVDTTYLSWDLDTGPVLINDNKTYWTSGNGLNYGNYQDWVGEAGYPVDNSPFAYDLSGYTNDLPVAWEEGDSLIASDSDTQVFHAKTTLALQPAGQDPPGAQRSYLVLVGAQEYGPLLDYNITDLLYPETLLDEVAYTPLSPEQLQVNGQTATDTGITDSNGLTWGLVVLNGPSGASLPLAPTATLSNKNDAAVFQMEVTNLQITANGVPLDPNILETTTNFCVGEEVAFALTNLPGNVIATNFQWSFGGVYFNAVSNAVPGLSFPICSPAPYVDASLLQDPTPSAWWISEGEGAPAATTADVIFDLLLTNGTLSHSLRVRGLFPLVMPRARIVATTGVVSLDSNLLTAIGSSCVSGFGLHYGNPVGCGGMPGCLLSNSFTLPSGYSGSFEWAQVVTHTLVRYQANDGTSNWYRYEHALLGDINYPFTNNPIDDSPNLSIDSVSNKYVAAMISVSDRFTTILEFRPDGGNWVPLRLVNWGWDASGTLQGTNWAATNLSDIPNPGDLPATNYPFWTNNVINFVPPQYTRE